MPVLMAAEDATHQERTSSTDTAHYEQAKPQLTREGSHALGVPDPFEYAWAQRQSPQSNPSTCPGHTASQLPLHGCLCDQHPPRAGLRGHSALLPLNPLSDSSPPLTQSEWQLRASPADRHSVRDRMHHALGLLQSNTQSHAEAALKQASATAVVSDFVTLLVKELEEQAAERSQLHSIASSLQAENGELETVAEELTRQLKVERMNTAALERAQGTWQDEADASKRRLQAAEEHARAAEQRAAAAEAELESALSARRALKESHTSVTAQLAQASQAAQAERAQLELALAQKQQLQGQVKQMVAAERELTVHLRDAHSEIETQISALKEEVKSERRAKEVMKRKKTELENQVKALAEAGKQQSLEMSVLQGELRASQTQLKALKVDMKQERRRRKLLREQDPGTDAAIQQQLQLIMSHLASPDQASPDCSGHEAPVSRRR